MKVIALSKDQLLLLCQIKLYACMMHANVCAFNIEFYVIDITVK